MPTSPGHDVARARLALGQRLAALRKAAGYTQHDLAPKTFTSRSTIANVELGRQGVERDFWTRCDDVLETGGSLAADYDRIRTLSSRILKSQAAPAGGTVVPRQPAPAGLHGRDLVSLLGPIVPGQEVQPHQLLDLWAPQGRHFPGVAVQAHVHTAVDDGRILASVPAGYREDPFLRGTHHGLVIGRTDGPNTRMFGLDTRSARRRLQHAAVGARLLIPKAYILDELTFAILWAVANLDAALLADDSLLAECCHDLAPYERLPKSSASGDLAVELSAAGRMWLGSAFCAGHILRHSDTLIDVPMFWTREQRGEEASAWLLFAHKADYLEATSTRYATSSARVARAFCLPRSAVEESQLGERLLLFLAVALMESYGIEVVITDEPEYAAMVGFVSDRRRAIVANWVGADGIWHVDVTDDRPTLREYTDAADHTVNHSLTSAATGYRRMRSLADYLDLDWSWLIGRCRQLADYGCAGLAQPRSRHLSIAGVDRACRYLADLDPVTG